jgi:hypothetical protein
MNRSIFVCAVMLAASAFLGAQQASQSSPYEGVSHPPPDDTIVSMEPQAPAPAQKPSPAKLAAPQPAPASTQTRPQPAVQSTEPNAAPANRGLSYPGAEPGDGTDDGIVLVEPGAANASTRPAQRAEPRLNESAYANDPDGDIVRPAPPRPGELVQGTDIRVRLLQSLSTAFDQSGDTFRTRVVSDVIQDGKVLIPAGSEIDGAVERVSYGHFGGHGSIRLRPETVILPDGSSYRLYAQVYATAGSNTRVTDEGAIVPGSHLKKDSIEYGGAAGAGAITGAVLAGPAGALTGGLVGAGVITAHLLLSHPQPTLDAGTTLVFSLTRPLNLVPAGNSRS